MAMHYPQAGTRVLVALVTVVLLGAVLAVTAPEPAQAACTGTYSWSSASYYGRERSSSSGTCDGLKDYYGKVKDIFSDGYGVVIEAEPNGHSYTSPMSTYSERSYSYVDSNSWTRFRICRYHLTYGWMYNCATWGTNSGF